MEKLIPKIIGGVVNFIAFFFPKYAGKLAIKIFSTPRKGKLKPNEISFLESAEQKTLTYKNFNIKTYQWKGTKSTILLAHGWESNSFRWKDLITILIKNDFNVVALDAPAHGATGNSEFNAVLYSECIKVVSDTFKPNTVIGHSVGGMASVYAMYNQKIDSVEKLVLLGAPDTFTSILSSYENMMNFNNRTKKAIKAHILKKFNFPPEYFSTSNFTSNLKVNALIIHDKKDRIIPFSDGETIKSKLPNAEFIETRGYGHGLKSDEVYTHILNFLNA